MDFTINFGALNILAVFAATVAANLLGALWYSPFVFGKVWRTAANLPAAGMGAMANPVGTFISAFVLQLVAASLLAAMMGPGAGLKKGARLGSLIGFAFVFTALGVINLFEGRSFRLILVHSGYHILSLCVMGAILGSWS